MEYEQAINPDDICIKELDPNPPDRIFEIAMPAHCVRSIMDRLESAGQTYEGERLFHLLVEVCTEETKGRFDIETLWGASPQRRPNDPMPSPEEDFTFTMSIDELPAISWPDWSGWSIERPSMEISDDMVDAEVHEQCLELGASEVTESPLEVGDDAKIKVVYCPEGEGQSTTDELVIRVPQVGAPAILGGLAMPGLGSQLVGKKAGAELEVSHPEGHGAFSIEVIESHRRTPVTVDDVLSRYGIQNESVLRMQIRHSLEARFKNAQGAHMTHVIYERLMDQVEFPVSEAFFRRLLLEEGQRHGQMLQSQGMSSDQIRSKLEADAPAVSDRLRVSARRSTMTALLRREFEVAASESDIKKEIQDMAAVQGRRPEELRKEILDAGQIDGIAARVFERKITDEIIQRAQIVDVAVTA